MILCELRSGFLIISCKSNNSTVTFKRLNNSSIATCLPQPLLPMMTIILKVVSNLVHDTTVSSCVEVKEIKFAIIIL